METQRLQRVPAVQRRTYRGWEVGQVQARGVGHRREQGRDLPVLRWAEDAGGRPLLSLLPGREAAGGGRAESVQAGQLDLPAGRGGQGIRGDEGEKCVSRLRQAEAGRGEAVLGVQGQEVQGWATRASVTRREG